MRRHGRPPEVRSDEELAEALRGGDDGALAALYGRYRQALYAYCARMLERPEEARDAVQDVFLGLHERRDATPALRSVRAWLFALARNRCLNQLRERRTRERLAPAIAADAPRPAGAPAPGSGDEAALVRLALARLPAELREALVLREYHDLPYAEIADIAGCSAAAVKSRLFRARQALFEQLHPLLAEGDEPCPAKTRS